MAVEHPHRAYLGLGANLGAPASQLDAALHRLAATPGLQLLSRSRFYRSAPLGPPGQPDYCNAACVVASTLAPETLLDRLQALERAAGREGGAPRWSARRLDLDLLHVDGVTLDSPRLRLPHPEIRHRAFVLVPLAEIAPSLVLPGLGAVSTLAAAIDRSGLALWPMP